MGFELGAPIFSQNNIAPNSGWRRHPISPLSLMFFLSLSKIECPQLVELLTYVFFLSLSKIECSKLVALLNYVFFSKPKQI